ncbi:MAG: hypothetical protein H8E03_00775 [Pelagibacteraceae bacterium]|nr:hypothetical protein [Pelagibacteraceae bacterium]
MAENETKEMAVDNTELENIRTLQQKYQSLALQLGQVTLQRSQLNRELENVDSNEEKLLVAYDECRAEEETIVKSLTDKYGIGNLDIETGKFTPQK